MKNLIVLIFLLFSLSIYAQDYIMFETHSLTPKAGHEKAIEEEIAEHNQLYHADGPYPNLVFSVMNGPSQGDLIFAMGPCTFTQLDKRPNSAEHAEDWASVMLHAEKMSGVSYWRMNDELSINSDSKEYQNLDMDRVRFFDVADDELFVKVQKQITATIKAMGITRPRVMYKRVFEHVDEPDWAFVSPYKNWADLDSNPNANFVKTFKKIHGEAAYKTFRKEFDEAVINREDVFRMLRRDLMSKEKK